MILQTLHGLAYVAFQELATRIAHRNTGRYSDDPVADRIMVRIAADENLHMVFYRDMLKAAIQIEPSAAVRAIVDEVLAFQMPGAGIPNFLRKAADVAKAAGVDALVLNHLVPPQPLDYGYAAFLGDARKHFDGPIIVGEDGMLFSLPRGDDSLQRRRLF